MPRQDKTSDNPDIRSHSTVLFFLRMSFSLRSISVNNDAPLASPKHSHANQSGSRENLVTHPRPAIALCGALSLKKKGLPGLPLNAWNADGRQKFTSSHNRPGARWLNRQAWVAATQPSIAKQRRRCTYAKGSTTRRNGNFLKSLSRV